MKLESGHTQLLNNVINLRKRYAFVDKLSARPFNIFTILRSERNERFTHSAFIAELLNPKGSHCQGDIFLRLFLSDLEWDDIHATETVKTKITCEHYIKDGFIDIWMDLGQANICIENKIDAGDQLNQLSRYNNYCLSHNKPYKIIYLTLDGRDSEDAKNSVELEYKKWSYQTHIIPWLDRCIKETARIPALRETIYQYQQLLKKLCNMLQNEDEAMELNELLKTDLEHFEAAYNIHEQFKTTKYELKKAFWKEIEMYFSNKYNESLTVELWFSENDTYPKLLIGHKELDEWYVCFCIERIQGRTYYGIYSFGYGSKNDSQKKIINKYKTELALKDFKSEAYWFAWKYYDGIDFSAIDTLKKLYSVIEKDNLIKQIVSPVDDLIKENAEHILKINKQIHGQLS